MPGVPGKTNNPNGAPKKDRALTKLLMTELSHKVKVGDEEISGKKLIAMNVVNAVTTGRVRFPNDTEDSIISIKDWIDFMKWLYTHVDGQAKSEFDVTSAGEKIETIKVIEIIKSKDE